MHAPAIATFLDKCNVNVPELPLWLTETFVCSFYSQKPTFNFSRCSFLRDIGAVKTLSDVTRVVWYK